MKKPKILFIPSYDFVTLGVRTLQAILKDKGYPTNIIFFKELISFNKIDPPTHEEKVLLLKEISKIKPDVICFSIRSPFFNIMSEITLLVKKNFPDVIIVWGGTHATICPEECIEYADYVNVGEGETSLLKFVQRVEENKSLDHIKNFWVKKSDRIIKNDLNPLLQNLDEIPFFDYSMDNKCYIEHNKIIPGDPLDNPADNRKLNRYSIMASRGCPYMCTYCTNSYLHRMFEGKGNFVRMRSVKNVIDELVHAKKHFKNLKEIFFYDEVFVLDKEWLKEFAKEFSEKINLEFGCEFYPNVVDEEIVSLLKNLGLTNVTMGIQTGSERVRHEVFKRFTPNDKILNAAKIFKKYKLLPDYDIILDNPYETVEDMKESVKFLLKIPRPYNLHLYSLVSFPKTDLTKKMIDDKIISVYDATKVLTNWRMSLNYKMSDEHLCYNALVSMISKSFVPKKLISFLSKRKYFWKHPYILIKFANLANKVKILSIGFKRAIRGDISYAQLKRYLKRFSSMSFK